MSMLRSIARAYVIDRIVRGGRRSHRAPSPWYARPRPRHRRRSGFGFYGPLPTYRTTTRRGSRVHVSGCCLPIPLTFALGATFAIRRLRRR